MIFLQIGCLSIIFIVFSIYLVDFFDNWLFGGLDGSIGAAGTLLDTRKFTLHIINISLDT
jgi:hypothetical protein